MANQASSPPSMAPPASIAWKNSTPTSIATFLQGLGGQSDAMTVVEMLALLESLSLDDVSAVTSEENLDTIRDALLASSYGVQEINGGKHEFAGADCDHSVAPLPRAFSLLGQRWTPDAWTFQKVVFSEVTVDGLTVPRRLPSSLDVAYSTLGNDTAYPILLDRMMDPSGVPFRDGFDYRPNLQSARATLDAQDPEFWTEHLYGSWLHSLRTLSPALPQSAPDTFRTEAWKRRTMNTQLVSWTHLRHDTLLYAKQSFTPPALCEYPDGYVDPYPALWQRLSDMAQKYRSFLSTYSLSGTMGIQIRDLEILGDTPLELSKWTTMGYLTDGPPEQSVPDHKVIDVDRGERLSIIQAHLDNFSTQCLKLKETAAHQLAGQMHTEEMKTFVGNTVETFTLVGCTGDRRYSGWFPNLYFHNAFSSGEDHPSSKWNPSVVDVHTDSVDTVCFGDPGAVLHEGVGRAQFMLVAVKHPDGSTCAYGGPVMSHHEFTKPHGVRMSDEEWKSQMAQEGEPAPADWKQGFLITE